MLRKLALSLAIAGAIGASNAYALGLGEIRVKSALNEPLNAEIKLLQVRDLSPMQIRPRMADIDEFSLAGISKSRFLSNVKFQVKVQPDGTGLIEMHSSTPVKEPFLNFLVEVNWPSGRLVREYTVLLDPPVFDASPVAGTVQPAAKPAQSMPAPAPVTAQSQPQSVTSPKPRPENASTIKTRMNPKTEIYVDVHDTLWVLAKNNRPNSSVSVEQMMLAMQRKNPASFPTDNINFLKAGTVMKLPTLDEIRKLTRKQAVAEVVHQTQLWKQRRSKSAASAKAAVNGGKNTAGKSSKPAPEDSGKPDGTLQIVTPKQEPVANKQNEMASDSGMAPASDAKPASAAQENMPNVASAAAPSAESAALMKRNAELENRLLTTQETVDKLQRDNTELNSKVDSIASQLDKLQRLIDLKEQELALMQKKMALQQAQDKKSESGFLDTLLKTPAYLAGIGAAVIAVLLGLLFAGKRRRKKDEEADEPSAAPAAAAAAMGAAAASTSDDSDAIPDVEAEPDVVAVAEEPPREELHQPEEAPLAADVQDDVSEEDLADLDLDMDLDLDEEGGEPESGIDAKDFDLGIDDDVVTPEDVAATPEPVEDDLDSALDDILDAEDERPESFAQADEPEDSVDSALDDLLAESDDLPVDEEMPAEEALSFGESLPGGDDAETGVDASDEESETAEEDVSELDFALDTSASDAAEDESEDVLELPDDLEFDVQQPGGVVDSESAASETSEDDELSGLDFAVDLPEGQAETAAEGDDDMLDDFFAEEKVESEDEFAPIADSEDVEPLTDEPIEVDTGEDTTNVEVLEPASDDGEFDIDEDLEAMLKDTSDTADEEEELPGDEISPSGDDLDALLAAFDAEDEDQAQRSPTPGERVEEELTANIAHDLEGDLDSEIDDLLGSTDDEIALDEESAEEVDDFDSMHLLDGADEIETKLDLARAYIEMEDTDGARDILNEILKEGNETQRQEAQKLIQSLS